MIRSRKAFTLVELLVVIAIIALLISILVPALGRARDQAKVTGVRAMLHSLGVGLEQFNNELGYYPSSSVRYNATLGGDGEYALKTFADGVFSTSEVDVGAHRLAEAMFGLDQLGYSTCEEGNPALPIYNVNSMTGKPCNSDETRTVARFGPYVSLDNLPIGSLKDDVPLPEGYSLQGNESKAWANTNPVILDGLNRKEGRPILYYKANTRGSWIHKIYNYADNEYITNAFEMTGLPSDQAYNNGYYVGGDLKSFCYYVWDQKTGVGADDTAKLQSPSARPYKRDSFILISAGLDGDFGTEDDVCNFTRR